MTDKLRSCPFCGCESVYEITRQDTIVDKIPQLFCNGCKMTFEVENDSPFLDDDKTFQYLKEKLHTTWNTRKPMERIVEQLVQHAENGLTRKGSITRVSAFVQLNDAIEIVKGCDFDDRKDIY